MQRCLGLTTRTTTGSNHQICTSKQTSYQLYFSSKEAGVITHALRTKHGLHFWGGGGGVPLVTYPVVLRSCGTQRTTFLRTDGTTTISLASGVSTRIHLGLG